MPIENPCRNDRRMAAALAALAVAVVLAPLAALAQAPLAQAALVQAAAAQDERWSEPGVDEPRVQLALNGDSAGATPSGSRPDFYRQHWHRGEDSLDYRIRHISRELDLLDRDPDFLTSARPIVPASDQAPSTASVLVPLSFRIMNFLSIALALGGLGVVLCNRPELTAIRGKNDSRDARRTLIRCVVVLLVLNAADLGFTSFLVPSGGFVELNPLAELLTNSLPALIAAKSAVIGCSAFLFLAFWRHQIAQLASWGAAATYVVLAMWWAMYFHAATS
jgi:Domain of unknown function (DUF5658)